MNEWWMMYCSWNRLGKMFDCCPDYFQVCQYLNDTNNPGFWERDDVVCAVSPFQSNLSSWQNSAGHHMHTDKSWTEILAWRSLFFFAVARVVLPVLISAAWLLITRSSRCSSAVVSDEESQEIRTQHWLPEPTGVTLSPPSGVRTSLSGVPLLSCYLVPLSGHGKLAPFSVLQ